MAAELNRIDIDDVPELLRIAEEVHESGEPRVLRREGRDVAILQPVKPVAKRRRGRVITEADREAMLSAAGGWSDVDTDKLIEAIYEGRRLSSRPPSS